MNLDPKSLTDEPEASPKPPATEASALSTPNMATTDAFVERINAMTDGGITAEHIRAILAAVNTANSGAAVGTVLRDDADGKIATRISQHGVEMWRITGLDGAMWNDMEPTLPWTKLADPIAGL